MLSDLHWCQWRRTLYCEGSSSHCNGIRHSRTFQCFPLCTLFATLFTYIRHTHRRRWRQFVVWVLTVSAIYWYGWNVDRLLKYDSEKWTIFRVYSPEIITSTGEISCFRLKILVMVHIGMNFSIWVWRVGRPPYFLPLPITWKIPILYFLNFIFQRRYKAKMLKQGRSRAIIFSLSFDFFRSFINKSPGLSSKRTSKNSATFGKSELLNKTPINPNPEKRRKSHVFFKL